MIKNTLQEKIKEALKAGDSLKVSTYRLLLSALNNEQIAKQHELSNEEEIGVIKRQVKQREEAAEAWKSAGRSAEAEKESKEADILKEFLPEQLNAEDILKIVEEVVREIGNTQDFGVIMKHVMEKTKGQADGKVVSEIVKQKLAK